MSPELVSGESGTTVASGTEAMPVTIEVVSAVNAACPMTGTSCWASDCQAGLPWKKAPVVAGSRNTLGDSTISGPTKFSFFSYQAAADRRSLLDRIAL